MDPFKGKWNKDYIRLKVDQYLWTYLGYFLGIFLLMFIVDKSRLGKSYVESFVDSAVKSKCYMTPLSINSATRHVTRGLADVKDHIPFKTIYLRQLVVQDRKWYHMYNNRGELANQAGFWIKPAKRSRGSDMDLDDIYSGGTSVLQTTVNPLAVDAGVTGRSSKVVARDSRYAALFYQYLVSMRCYLGCRPSVFPNGLYISYLDITLKKGVFEDFCLHLVNNHTILGCMFSVKKSNFSRSSRRIVFIAQHCVTFFMVAFCAALIMIFRFKRKDQLSIVLNVLVIRPLAAAISVLIRYLLNCSLCGFSMKYLGRFIAFPIVIGAISLLLLAALFTTGHSRAGIVISYMVQVHFVSFFVDLIYAVLLFVDRFHVGVYINLCGKHACLLRVGGLFCEIVLRQKLKEGDDYTAKNYRPLLGLIAIDYLHENSELEYESGFLGLRRSTVVSRANIRSRRKPLLAYEANHAEDVMESGSARPGRESDTFVLNSASNYADTGDVVFSMMNPLHRHLGAVEALRREEDELQQRSAKKATDVRVSLGNIFQDSLFVGSNPMLSGSTRRGIGSSFRNTPTFHEPTAGRSLDVYEATSSAFLKVPRRAVLDMLEEEGDDDDNGPPPSKALRRSPSPRGSEEMEMPVLYEATAEELHSQAEQPQEEQAEQPQAAVESPPMQAEESPPSAPVVIRRPNKRQSFMDKLSFFEQRAAQRSSPLAKAPLAKEREKNREEVLPRSRESTVKDLLLHSAMADLERQEFESGGSVKLNLYPGKSTAHDFLPPAAGESDKSSLLLSLDSMFGGSHQPAPAVLEVRVQELGSVQRLQAREVAPFGRDISKIDIHKLGKSMIPRSHAADGNAARGSSREVSAAPAAPPAPRGELGGSAPRVTFGAETARQRVGAAPQVVLDQNTIVQAMMALKKTKRGPDSG